MRTLGRRAILPLACAGVLLLAGCGPLVRETWSRPGATRQTVSQDAFECEREATRDATHGQEQGAYGFTVPRREPVFEACMRARGYERVTSLPR